MNYWKQLAESLDKLPACYRTGRRPSGKLLDEITKLREKANAEDLRVARGGMP